MKVLLITENLMEGGSQAFILRLATALQNQNTEASILLLNNDKENRAFTKKFSDVNIIRLKFPFKRLVRFIDKIIFRLGSDFSLLSFCHQRIIQKRFINRYDIFHTHYPKVDYLISKLSGIKQVVTVHGDYKDQYEHNKRNGRSIWNHFDSKMNWLKNRVTTWIVISDEQRQFFLTKFDFSADRIFKIYNGFQPGTATTVNKPSKKFTVGMIARGVAEKGWAELLESFLLLQSDCRLLLAGSGYFLDKLQEKFKNYDAISFVGYQQDSIAFINQCDVMALPSYSPTESLPYVIIEALSCGKPVIASDVGEIKNMLKDEVSGELAGFVLPLTNQGVSVEELAMVIEGIYNSNKLLNHKSQLATKAFKKFEMQKCLAAYTEIYKKTLPY